MEYGLYHGCGNTFLIGLFKEGINYPEEAKSVCTQYHVDGLILLIPHPLTMKIYNADGSEATMCGNGIRCFAKFAYDYHYLSEKSFDVQTLAGIIPLKIISTNPFMVSVNLGRPNFSSKQLGIKTHLPKFINEIITVNNQNYLTSAVFLGTDHAVIIGDDYRDAQAISTFPLFTKGINVNFVKIKSRKEIYVKTYERGVGWTKACGTGSSSSFIVCHKLGLVDNSIEVIVDGGNLLVYLDGDDVILEGPAETIKEPKL